MIQQCPNCKTKWYTSFVKQGAALIACRFCGKNCWRKASGELEK